MIRRIRPRLTYANVIATLALFLALGGGAYAAFKLPKDSVGSKQIKANAVNSSKVKDRSLLAGDFKAGQIPAGPRGLQGLPGSPGLKGDTGDVARWTSSIVPNEEIFTTGIAVPFEDGAPPGPSVTVTVPTSGLVEVYARVHIKNDDANGDGQVGLRIDGAHAEACGGNGLIILTPVTTQDLDFTTGGSCGTQGAGSSIMVTATPGTHTFDLVYGVGKGGGGSTTVHFSDRRLYVAPRP
ncbi:MAG: hypothetical protein QOC77_913 [Thermoleophilaceae bacterium]|nr:hypothetical protein [Thermoleophilaceae bacterium]